MGYIQKMIDGASLALAILAVTRTSAQETGKDYVFEPFGTISGPRGLILDPSGDLLVVSTGRSSVIALFQEGNGTVGSATIVSRAELVLTHGIAYREGYLYCSSQSKVYRWPYSSGQREEVDLAREEVVIRDIPDQAPDHVTRTMIFDDRSGLLYVTIGARNNIDPDSTEARLMRFNVTSIPSGGIPFNQGEIIADGVRNQAGLAWDLDGFLWGVDNGADDLFREDLGGDIHVNNPADEMTRFDQEPGTFYGYPYCWSVDELENHTKGEQLAWPDFMNDGIHTDEWCKNRSNTLPPTLPLPAHYAALGITFYDAAVCNTSESAFPCHMKGDAFIAFHGSWNRFPAPQEGFKVVRIPMNNQTGLPVGAMEDVIFETDPDNCGRCFRPVDLVFDNSGELLVTSDFSNSVIRVKWNGTRD